MEITKKDYAILAVGLIVNLLFVGFTAYYGLHGIWIAINWAKDFL